MSVLIIVLVGVCSLGALALGKQINEHQEIINDAKEER